MAHLIRFEAIADGSTVLPFPSGIPVAIFTRMPIRRMIIKIGLQSSLG
jgi:hypothetical protein